MTKYYCLLYFILKLLEFFFMEIESSSILTSFFLHQYCFHFKNTVSLQIRYREKNWYLWSTMYSKCQPLCSYQLYLHLEMSLEHILFTNTWTHSYLQIQKEKNRTCHQLPVPKFKNNPRTLQTTPNNSVRINGKHKAT